MDLGLTGKKVIMNGGGHGLGLASLKLFAAEGADVADDLYHSSPVGTQAPIKLLRPDRSRLDAARSVGQREYHERHSGLGHLLGAIAHEEFMLNRYPCEVAQVRRGLTVWQPARVQTLWYRQHPTTQSRTIRSSTRRRRPRYGSG